MRTSVIRYRVADFLKQSAPFDAISEEDLLEIAASGKVSFHEAGEFVIRKGEKRKPHVWVIQQGTVEVIGEGADGDRLSDLLGSGDTIGLSHFTQSDSYVHSARTVSDVILYSIDARSFAVCITKYPRVAQYLAAHLSVSARDEDAHHAAAHENSRARVEQPASWLDAGHPSLEFMRTRLRTVGEATAVREAARAMTDTGSDAVAVVDRDGVALGIITDRELRKCIAAGAISAEHTSESVMMTGFPTAAPDQTSEAYLLQMMRSRHSTLAITRDGTPRSALVGLLSDTELSFFTGRNPSLLLGALLEVRTDAERSILLRQARALTAEALTGPAAFDRAATVASLFDAALAESVVRAAIAEVPAVEFGISAASRCCWLLFGRAGRAEPIEFVQPEIGVVYEDPLHDRTGDVPRYLQAIGERISHHLTACELDRPQAASVGREISRIRSLSEWKRFFHGIISDPIDNEIWMTRRLLDFRVLYGDPGLERQLVASITEDLRLSRGFIPILANDTLEHLPPMTFFRGLVIELDGAQKQTLNLGATALGPITDAARVHSLAAGSLDAKSTLERLGLAAATVPEAAPIFNEAAEAFRVASFYAAVAAATHPRHSSIIEPDQLTKYDQRLLKTTFQSIQKLIELTSTPSRWKQPT